MATYIAKTSQWRACQSHLQVISAFDFKLEFKLLPKTALTLFGLPVFEVTYVPTDLKYEGRKLLHEVINHVSPSQDVLLNPETDDFAYSSPTDIALIKRLVPWVDQAATSLLLSEFGGGLAGERVEPTTSKKLWCIDYAATGQKKYTVISYKGEGEAMPLHRVEILFHEMAHVSADGDPHSGSGDIVPALIPTIREARAIERTNLFRAFNNPRGGDGARRNPMRTEVSVLP